MKNSANMAMLAGLALLTACQGPAEAEASAGSAATPLPGSVEIGALTHACRHYAMNNGEFPDGLGRLVERDSQGAAYLQEASAPVSDVWGQPYEYKLLSGGTKCRIFSLGRDQAVGGEGADKDVKLTLLLPGR